ncbi:MAG: caspase family protein [Phaeodactylibacter sp.]|nr:caspase family protein [Phaeodactylibacter sp.]MCB9274450.1 caspase family protein [Lewinellaceae bacterium]
MNRGVDLSGSETGYDPQRAVNYILAIGIDDYEYWDKLHNAVKDADTFVNVLTQQYQFDTENVIRLFDRDATEDKIRDSIRTLKRRITANDNLILYYSGHGHYDKDFDEGHWVPVDARPDSSGRYISNSDIIKWINAIEAQHILLVIDSCFSGSLVVRKRSTAMDEQYRSRRIISSGRLEAVSDGLPGHNSPFAEGVITYLKKNTKEALNTTELVQRIKEYVAGKANQSPVEGRVQNSADENGEFVFHLKISEEDFWKNVQAADSVKAYQDYLTYYPDGKYITQAERRLDALREDSFWENAKAKDSELAYENYLKKYAGTGKYLAQAQHRLEALHDKQMERRKVLEELGKKDEEREGILRQFQERINEAEALFLDKKLEQARELYRESLHYYMEGFAPSYDYIEQQVNLCTNGITFLQYFDSGRQAMDRGNYRLALQYFNEALKTGDDPRVEDLIKVCRQRLVRPAPQPQTQQMGAAPAVSRPVAQRQPVARPSATSRPKKKRSFTWLFMLIGFVVVASIAVVAAYESGLFDDGGSYRPDSGANYPSSDYGSTDQSATGQSSYSKDEDEPAEPAAPAASSYERRIVGSWSVADIQSNGVSFRQMGAEYQNMLDMLNYTYTFSRDGNLTVTSGFNQAEYHTYYIEGDMIYTQGAYYSQGSIDELGRKRMRITFNMQDAYGNPFPMTIVYNRMD